MRGSSGARACDNDDELDHVPGRLRPDECKSLRVVGVAVELNESVLVRVGDGGIVYPMFAGGSVDLQS